MSVQEYARTDLDMLADDAEARWAMHWAVCRHKDKPEGCRRCDQLDDEARTAERNAAFLGQQMAGVR